MTTSVSINVREQMDLLSPEKEILKAILRNIKEEDLPKTVQILNLAADHMGDCRSYFMCLAVKNAGRTLNERDLGYKIADCIMEGLNATTLYTDDPYQFCLETYFHFHFEKILCERDLKEFRVSTLIHLGNSVDVEVMRREAFRNRLDQRILRKIKEFSSRFLKKN